MDFWKLSVCSMAFAATLCACGSTDDTTTIADSFEALSAGAASRFRAHLTGDAEVADVDTRATGQALLAVTDDGELIYRIIVSNMDDVILAHIHCAPEGENGPIGVTLFMGGPVSVNGILIEATADAPDPGNTCGWVDMNDVVDAILAGEAYVNVHTQEFPSGEIRGQLR